MKEGVKSFFGGCALGCLFVPVFRLSFEPAIHWLLAALVFAVLSVPESKES